MSDLHCPCGTNMPLPRHTPPALARCLNCGRDLSAQATAELKRQEQERLAEEPIMAEAVPHWSQRMLSALLDPRSIQWMLLLGGGLMVLGLVVWLVSSTLFENKLVVAATLTTGSLLVHFAGCGVALKTRFKTAGRSLAFLGCLLLPLNLWFYNAHDLLTLEGQLWIGGVVCSALYIATVLLLKDPLFVYAVEGGITLTAVLLLGQQGVVADATWLSVIFMVLALVSIHGERVFPPAEETFSRKRFGLPMFWSGQVQLAAAVVSLLGSQLFAIILAPDQKWFATPWLGNYLTQHDWLAGGLWLAAAYAYVYSDLAVRRLGWYLYAAVGCLIGAELTIIGHHLDAEWMIAMPALTAVIITLLANQTGKDAADQGIARRLPPLAMILAGIAVLAGLCQHVLATSLLAADLNWDRPTGWAFLGTMIFVAVCNRIMSVLLQPQSQRAAGTHVFFSAASVLIAAASLARCLHITSWTQQAPLVMLVPMAYLAAARLWKGRNWEHPVAISAQVGAAVILWHVLFNTVLFRVGQNTNLFVEPVFNSLDNLWLGLVFGEAAIFYVLYAVFFRQSVNIYLATAASCAAVWQLANFYGVPDAWYTMAYASLGLIVLAVARAIQPRDTFPVAGEAPQSKEFTTATAALHSANGLLSLAFISAILQALSRLVTQQAGWQLLSAMALTTLAGLVAVALAPSAAWRRIYATCTIVLAGLAFILLNVLITLTAWEKAELFAVVVGLVLLVASYIGRFVEREKEETDHITLGLWFGSVLPVIALFSAAMYYRFEVHRVSLHDEMGLLTVAVLMLVTGYAWQLKSPVIVGGGALGLYLLVLIGMLAYFPNVAIGFYLAIGGGLLFACGVALSVFRERLSDLPRKISEREGVFQVLNWR
ncbi:hypothetical protein [Anatilimnocola floriformis]|uniref:hypothetical protein n=1 Tax=Anatilimnocola floriformis TaxID=2948575 RepID=UPI0020C2F015|nr:hypothetical protein [Anatilimnocola floriformis]